MYLKQLVKNYGGALKDASARLRDLARTLKKIFNISRSQSMESLVVNDRYFKFIPEINREPVKIRKNGVIWQKLGERVADRAAAFCIRWSCLITFLGKPLVMLWCNKSLNKKLGCIKDKLFTNEPNFTEWISAHCCHPWGTRHTQRFVQENSNVKPALCHHKHEYVTKQVDHGVTEMILQEVQFCLSLNLAYSEASI